jgi:hypothetical protein
MFDDNCETIEVKDIAARMIASPLIDWVVLDRILMRVFQDCSS